MEIPSNSRPTSPKTITIDWNDPSDLEFWARRIKLRRNKLLRGLGWKPVKFNGERYHADFLLPAINSILDNVRVGIGNYYVYLHCNPLIPLQAKDNIKHLILALRYPFLKHEPFYVGKGLGNRFLDLSRNDSHRKIRQKILSKEREVSSVKIVEGLSEESALDLESNWIDVLGLRCYSKHGILCNLDEGQDAKLRRSSYTDKTVMKILQSNGF